MISFLPELILSAGISAMLVLILMGGAVPARLFRPAACAAALAALAASLATLGAPAGDFFDGAYRIDALSQVFKAALCFAFFLAAFFSGKALSIPARLSGEYFLFLGSATLGMAMLTSAVEMLTFLVSLELSAYSLYLLVPLKGEKRNSEAGIKYILFGAATSGLLLFGLGILAALGQTTNFAELAGRIGARGSDPAFLAALLLVGTALFFKLSLVPFHFWAPDAYEAAATPVTAFIATASKAAAAAALLRVFPLFQASPSLVSVLGVLAFLSMTAGNTAALIQKDLKRLFAYSSIAQAGYLVIGLLSASGEAYRAVFFYGIAYVLMNAGVFLVTLVVAEDRGTDNPGFEDFSGLADRSPLLALTLLLGLLSLAGIPPLVGFTGKWFLFAAAMKEGHVFLVIAAVINSVVSLFYYLTVVKYAYLHKAPTSEPLRFGAAARALCFCVAIAMVAFGLFPNPILGAAFSVFTPGS